MRIDLNADVGEGYDDEPLFAVVSSVNVACGAHAGDHETMARTIEAAARAGVAIGAHPGYPDRAGFGRAPMDIDADTLRSVVLDQIDVLAAIAARLGVELVHMKPHGALYNQAATDPALAALLAGCAASHGLVLVGLASSAMTDAGALGEGFADRAYRSDATLAPREMEGAVIHDPAAAARQAVAVALGRPFEACDGAPVVVRCSTVCVHGDTPGSLAIARAVRAALEAAGIAVGAR